MFTTISDDAAVTEKPSRLWWSYRFYTSCCVFSLEGKRQNWAFSQLEMWGSGADSELVMMAADHFMSARAKEIREREREGKKTDRHGTCEISRASSTPVQIHVKKKLFLHKN